MARRYIKKINFNQKVSLSHIYAVCNGVIIGALVGIIVSLFRLLVSVIFKNILHLYQLVRINHLFLILILTINVLIAMVIGKLIRQEPNITGPGISKVKSLLSNKLHYSFWSVLWHKFIGSTLVVGSGVFVGHEGPSIQIGAAVGQGIAKYTHRSKNNSHTMIAGGAAAGLAAIFNSPIASTLFILENIYNSFYVITWLTALTASIISSYLSTFIFGQRPILYMPHLQTFPPRLYIYLIILGITIGILGICYQKINIIINNLYSKCQFIPTFLYLMIPLLLMIPIGIYFPDTIGSGNDLVLVISKLNVPFWLLIIYAVIRIIGASLSASSGLPGGMLVPILSLGALFGTIYGYIIFHFNLMPEHYIINLSILGMAGFFAGIKKTPFTPVLLVTEMVGSLHHLTALALVSVIAYVVNETTQSFTKLLH